MPQINKFANDLDILDNRQFFFGDVWTIYDQLVSIPDADRITNGRTQHISRAVVIVQNNPQNNNPLSPVILIAPLCHDINVVKNHDVPLTPKKDNVKQDSYARLRLIQPILKKDLHKKVATISDESKDEILDTIMDMIGVDIT